MCRVVLVKERVWGRVDSYQPQNGGDTWTLETHEGLEFEVPIELGTFLKQFYRVFPHEIAFLFTLSFVFMPLSDRLLT